MRDRLASASSLLLLGVFFSATPEPAAGLGPGRTAADEEHPLGVEELMRNVSRHRGSVLVEGVVSGLLPGRRGVGLIDLKELEECGVTTCAPLTLPVHWKGTLPATKELVLARGRVGRVDGKLAFVATSLEVIRPEAEAGSVTAPESADPER